MKTRVLVFLLILFSLLSLFVGVADITVTGLLSDAQMQKTFIISRVPRLISILIVGSGMAVSGMVMQQISGNRFVSPSTAGTNEFAKLGVLFAILITPSASIGLKLVLAFFFALAGTWFFMFIINHIKLKDSAFIPLIGIMLGGIIGSLTTFVAYRFDLIQNIDSWLQGRFTLIISGRYELLYLGIPIVILVYLYANQFTIVGMGGDFSTNLGLNYKLVVNIGLILCSVMSAAVIVTVGSIAFIGVIVPNIVRLYIGDNLRKTLPHTALLGAVFVLVCDILGRIVIAPYEIPIGVTAGTLGSAIFLYLILGKRNYGI